MGQVSAHPTKNFFVQMLTRDIDLHDAILDLLDNCVDGAIRSTKGQEDNPERYHGFGASIDFDGGKFTIKDNCGGISRDLVEHAFQMGRPDLERDADLPTVGMYGIGMKRAIFKMGQNCEILSRADDHSFRVTITPDWLTTPNDWFLPYDEIDPPFEEKGTSIQVGELYPGVNEEFFLDQSIVFLDRLEKMISSHYCFIIHKGFTISLNGNEIRPKPLALTLSQDTHEIVPYLYQGEFGDVSVSLAVGFLGQAPTEDEIDENLDQRRRTEDAGWTIICNDRVVVYKDRTRLTGWGVGRVPSYHTQFITVSGVVEFRSNHAEHLPVTTTKRGIDASSQVFLRVKDFMMEGMKIFTNHTNVWKKNKEEEKRLFESTREVNVREIPQLIPEIDWTNVRGEANEKKYMPTLPRPSVEDATKQIRFTKPINDIRAVADFVLEDREANPSEVGSQCFDMILAQVKEKR